MNILQKFEKKQLTKWSENRETPKLDIGDTISILVKIQAGTNRTQDFTGILIAKKNRGINSSFLVRALIHKVWVERRFMLYSPMVTSIKILKKGIVCRAKLYYLRSKTGKAARIPERRFIKPATKPTASNTKPAENNT